ncbi:MAG: VIT and VWA domain-containing protein [Candidatus Obscuribacterales bacterium]|nr:VIT and VWA domain-containing protein [Candidatus Obscuribacterales bacterium]
MNVSLSSLRRSVTLAVSLATTLSVLGTTVDSNSALARTKPVSTERNKPVKDRHFTGNGSGALAALTDSGKQIGQCPLKHTAVKASVSGYVARVSVKQSFHNSYKDKIEAVYTFPLPENAAVDEMTMKIGNRLIHGNIKKREEAREIYEQAKSQGHVASLLDQERPNIFTQAVANIEPGETVDIEIKYVELLPYEAGTYTFAFPTVVGPRFNPGNSIGKSGSGRANDTDVVGDASKITPPVAAKGERAGHDISIELDIDSAVTMQNLRSSLHEVQVTHSGNSKAHVSLIDKQTIPNKDFVLSWDVAGDKLQSGYLTHNDGKSGYFTIMMMPPKRVTPENVAPKEMVFLIDCSGSQSGAPLQKAKETLLYIIDHMNPNDTFQIISFNNQVTQFAERSQKVNEDMRRRARQFIEGLQANGGTWMAPAVEKVCAMPTDENRLRIVSFMTDGYVGNDFEILGLIRKYRSKTRWFPFGTGSSVNRFLIDGIAKEGGGEAEYVLLNSPGNVVGKKFYDRISSPVLTDVKLQCHGVEVKEVFPHDISDVWAERPLYFKGRYTAPGAGTITLTGYAGGKPYKQELPVNFPAKQSANEVIKPVWARAKVDRLMSEDWFGAQQGQVNKELKDEIVKTALDYHIMTQYTSFVAVEEKRVTKNGEVKQIVVPVELPEGVSRKMTIGDKCEETDALSNNQAYSRVRQQVCGAGGGGFNGFIAPIYSASCAPQSMLAKAKTEVKRQDFNKKKDLSIEAKIAPELRKLKGQIASEQKITVQLHLKDSSKATLEKLRQLGFEVKSKKSLILIGKISFASLEKLAALTEVINIEAADK